MSKTKAIRAYMTKVAELGCILCKHLGFEGTPAELHHPRKGVGAGKRAPDNKVLPLCPEHHRGQTGVHGLGTKGFLKRYGLDEDDLQTMVQRELRHL